MRTVLETARDLADGRTTSRTLTEGSLARARDPNGEGKRIYLKINDESALAAADASDTLRRGGIVPSPLAGLPISVKDLFDVRGDVTTAGSVVLADSAPADADGTVITRLRQAGAVIIGRTNMTEFAYSGLGLNGHYDTPRNPWDRATGRIPGGSSSGAAVSVTDGTAIVGIGTDTGGSVRIPSALCGLTGFKPTSRRIPIDGVFPLASSLDSIGPLAASVACCAIVDAVMAGDHPAVPDALPIEGLRFAVPQTVALDDLDDTVAAAFDSALTALSRAGARVVDIPFAELANVPALGIILASEAYTVHRDMLASDGDRYDQRVRGRIERAKEFSAADYVDAQRRRADCCARANQVTAPFDAILMPTTARIAPPVAELDGDDARYTEANVLMLRNTTLGNALDRCALSIPCHAPGAAPVGLMVMGETLGDRRLLSVGLAVEAVLRRALA